MQSGQTGCGSLHFYFIELCQTMDKSMQLFSLNLLNIFVFCFCCSLLCHGSFLWAHDEQLYTVLQYILSKYKLFSRCYLTIVSSGLMWRAVIFGWTVLLWMCKKWSTRWTLKWSQSLVLNYIHGSWVLSRMSKRF